MITNCNNGKYIQRGELTLLSGNSNRDLAESVAKYLGIELLDADIEKFKDGEVSVKINQSIRGKDVYIMQPTSSPTNDNLMELLILIDACRRASAGYINAIVPYYGYARQDRKTRGREPITAKLVANLLTTAGADRVVTMDLHAGQIQGYFDIPVDHFSAIRLLSTHFTDIVKDNADDYVVVSPDLGGVRRAREFADYLKLPIAIIEKRRPKPNVSEVMSVIGEFKGKHAIIVDDMIDTAGTITNASEFLIDSGAKDVYIVATHGVFSGDAIDKLNNSRVKEVVITDTIKQPAEKLIDKLTIMSIAPLLAEATHRINTYESISGLFADGM